MSGMGKPGNSQTWVYNALTDTWSGSAPLTGSAIRRVDSYSLFLGNKLSSSPSSSKDSLGMNYFDSTKLNTLLGSQKFFFRSLFATNQTSSPAYVDLYDFNGIVNGFPGPISGSVLTCSSLNISQQQVDLSSIFTKVTGSGVLEARMWLDPTGSNIAGVVRSVRLDVEWS